jgi:hypothetical protein
MGCQATRFDSDDLAGIWEIPDQILPFHSPIAAQRDAQGETRFRYGFAQDATIGGVGHFGAPGRGERSRSRKN